MYLDCWLLQYLVWDIGKKENPGNLLPYHPSVTDVPRPAVYFSPPFSVCMFVVYIVSRSCVAFTRRNKEKHIQCILPEVEVSVIYF